MVTDIPQDGVTEDHSDETRYRIGQELGRGEMSVVYEAFDTLLERTVALKLLTLAPSLAPEQRDSRLSRFKREAEAVARIRHPNIVHVFDFGRNAEGTPYLVMEYVDGVTLSAYLASHGPLPPALAFSLLEQIADGLDAVHAQGVVHRDLKPGNIMLRRTAAERSGAHHLLTRGDVKLLDFGLARHGDDVTLTRTGVLVGSPAYLSPERVRGEPATTAADLWALAVVLYEMLAGRRPFAGEDTISVLYQIAHTEAPRLRGLGPKIEAVLARALDRTPERRYATARAFAEDFREAIGGEVSPLPATLWTPSDPAATSEVDTVVEDAWGASDPSLPTPATNGVRVGGLMPFDVPLPARHASPRRYRRGLPIGALILGPAMLALGGIGIASLAARNRAPVSDAAVSAPPIAATSPTPAAVQPSPSPAAATRVATAETPKPKATPAPSSVTPKPVTPQPAPTPRTVYVVVPSPTPLVAMKPAPPKKTVVAVKPSPRPTPVQVAMTHPQIGTERVPSVTYTPTPKPTPATTPAPPPGDVTYYPSPGASASPKPNGKRRNLRQVSQVIKHRRGEQDPDFLPPPSDEDNAGSRSSRDRDQDRGSDDASRVPPGDSLLGTWRGNIWKNRAMLSITSRDGDNFSGVLTLHTDRGMARMSVSGYVAPATGRMAFWSTGTLSGSAVTDFDIGQEQGKFISRRLMGGLGMDTKQGVFTWSLSR